jgi:signal transduction histidine kinase
MGTPEGPGHPGARRAPSDAGEGGAAVAINRGARAHTPPSPPPIAHAPHTRRLIALGVVAAGVAHEITNPLTYVTLSVTAARAELGAINGLTSEQQDAIACAEKLLRDALDGAERIHAVVSSVHMISRHDRLGAVPVDVRACVEAALRLVEHELNGRARLRVEYDDAPRVMGDEGKICQVLLNLLTNAIQAVPQDHPDAHEIHVRTRADEHGRAVIEVRDTGVGIAPHLIERIFDPFFTTKPIGEGTGLGLAISYDLVRSLGGEITAESTVGQGTTFRVVLPGVA